ncbi:MAG: serine hydrolase [Bacteroidetes bacterium]|nr:serine hydrolase [Bacteroidota bacterium]
MNKSKFINKVFLIVALLFLKEGCATHTKAVSLQKIKSETPKIVKNENWVEKTLASLTLEEKVSQLVFVWTSSSYYSSESEQWRKMEELAKKQKLGGFIFSIGDVYEYAIQINKLQQLSKVPLLIAGDYEWGIAMRVRNATMFPKAMALGAANDSSLTYQVGYSIAKEARAMGIHQNYAPVVDVNNNSKNPVINTRSFGDDPKIVSKLANAFIKGTQDGGVIATAKHFPGHGDTQVDSHLDLPILRFTKARFDSIELVPFKETINAGVKSIMVSHISNPAYDGVEGIPSTLSYEVTTNLLQKQLGFNGLIVTDALDMQGVTKKYGVAEAAILAIKAGNDILLMPPNELMAIRAVVNAVKNGEISIERIDHSVRKILKEKENIGLHKNRTVDVGKLFDVVGTASHKLLSLKGARKAITVLGNKNNLLPLSKEFSGKIFDLVISDSEDPLAGKDFHNELTKRISSKINFQKIDNRSNKIELDEVLDNSSKSDLVIIQCHYFIRSAEMTGFLKKDHQKIINSVLAQNKNVIVISFGNPYLIEEFPTAQNYICSYSASDYGVRATAEVLFAESPATGKLPITIPGIFKSGDGIQYPATVLRDGIPQEVGFDAQKLKKVDDVMNNAISDSAFPGGVLLIAKDGVVVHNRAYGFYDYTTTSQLVQNNSIYDLASVTKVIATTSAVMKLVSDKKLSLNDLVVKYIPEFGKNGKENITIYNLMVHNSGLPGWRKFYDFTRDEKVLLDSLYSSHLIYKTGDSTIYSDLGIITVGKIIEKITNTTLDKFVEKEFFDPLGMHLTFYNPKNQFLDKIAPTEIDTHWIKDGKAVRGRVHDENATVLNGISGHAGLFSTSKDLAIILQMLLNKGSYAGNSYLNSEIVNQFTTRQSSSSTRAIGWDTRSETGSFSGKYFSNSSFIHNGFTGTSVVVDPERNIIVILLTNRVYPTRESKKILQVRPQVHNAIMESLIQN